MIEKLGGRKFILTMFAMTGFFLLVVYVPEVRELAMKLLAVIVNGYIIGNVANKAIADKVIILEEEA